MNLKEALKAAIDGAKIRHSGWPVGVFVFWNGELFLDHHGDSWAAISSEKDTMDWEIVREPVKYSVDVYLSQQPKILKDADDVCSYLFGHTRMAIDKFKDYKKYRITVEEVND